MKYLRRVGIGALGAIALAESAWAHGVVVQTKLTPMVEVLGHYEDGRPLQQAQVKVFAPSDAEQPQFIGQTDDQGRYHFSPTEAGQWEIFIRQAGHGGETVIAVEPTDDNKLVVANTPSGHSWAQRLIMVGAVLWGCIGTALYFKGRST